MNSSQIDRKAGRPEDRQIASRARLRVFGLKGRKPTPGRQRTPEDERSRIAQSVRLEGRGLGISPAGGDAASRDGPAVHSFSWAGTL